MVRKYLELMRVLSSMVVHREWEVEGLVYGLLTGYPTMWVGPIGIAKTYLIDRLVASIKGAKLFRLLLTKFTEPEELVGPYNPKLLRKGRYVRIYRDKLPDADIAYLDEPFKASSAIRNYLLDIMLYGRFYDGERYVRTKTKALYMSANEAPRLVEDLAFFDRSAVRLFSQHLNWDEMIDVMSTPLVDISDVPKVLDIGDIEEGQREVTEIERNVAGNRNVLNVIRNLAKTGKEQSTEPMEISERRLVMIRRLVAVVSYVYDEEPSEDAATIAVAYGLPSNWETFTATISAINKLYPNSSIAYIEKINTIKAEQRNTKTEEDRKALQAKLEELLKQAPERHFLGFQQ